MNLPINQIIQGDCLDVLKTFPDKCVDLVLTDPPYGLGDKLFKGGSKNTNWAMVKYKGEGWDVVPSKELFDEIFRVSKHQIIFGGNYFILPPTRGIICWDKVQYAPNFSQWEMAWTSFDKPAKLFRQSFAYEKDHPTQKPTELFRKIINEYVGAIGSSDDYLILDPFLGSGTTAVAAKMENRNYIGIEISEKYCKIARQRVASAPSPLFT